ncbi:DUF885 domain-containing protein [Dactylosporangium sp. CA-092794]|uniref:DUF885 domain-containing protein n=1 Tax=Dactylosporangium sp. CA-092794 TaxID=3239929 RepID=UPI003D8FCAAA
MTHRTAMTPTRPAADAHDILDATWGVASRSPMTARHLSHALEIPDVSFEAVSRRAHAGQDILARLDALDVAGLSSDLLLTLSAARRLAEGWSHEEDWYWLTFDPLGEGYFAMFAPSAYSGGFLLSIIHEALAQVSLAGAAAIDRHVDTIGGYARLIRQFTERTAGQSERGIHMPALQLSNAVALVTGLKAAGLETLHAVAERSAGRLPASDRERIRNRITGDVEPAFDELLALLTNPDYAAAAPDSVGLASYPGGAEIYDELVKIHTTLDLTAQEVHDRGHARMARIEDEMRELMAGQGFAGTPAEYLASLAEDPAWRAATDEDIAAHFQRYIDRFAPETAAYFGRLPRAPYGVEPLPAAVSGSMTFGYYSAPQPDRDRGIYLFNGANLSQTALPMIAALNYHELVPGHHLHLALQHEAADAHPLRRHAVATAFTEGWAEYAGRLAGEIGMYRAPEERFGRLMMEAFLTSRLVVDTGMNALGWSLERAREYMREHSFMGPTEVDSETLRYSCDLPGQALAYKLGDDFFYDLREELRAVHGDNFRIADFHDAVLRAAGLPLPMVADYVRTELA